MKKDRTAKTRAWRKNMSNTGYNGRTIIKALEDAGAVGLVSSRWSSGFGVNKIF